MPFSQRSAFTTDIHPLTQTRHRLLASRQDVLDLTVSNPSEAGFAHDSALLAALSAPAGRLYSPDSFGLPSARDALCEWYGRQGLAISRDRICLTASTSEAYAHLFQLCCDPGDVVWVPQPSYPLLHYLAALSGVQLHPYNLRYDGEWHIDLGELERQPYPKAIVVIAPNNPTGNYLSQHEWEVLDAWAAAHDVALIVDEVFAQYPLVEPASTTLKSVLTQPAQALRFVLSGLSKVAALPQLKLGWCIIDGQGADEALRRLEIITDTFLSVNTPVQLALPLLLEAGDVMRARIIARCRHNFAQLKTICAGSPASVCSMQAGWSALLRLPAHHDDIWWAQTIAEKAAVLVQPGEFFDFQQGSHVVLSLLVDEASFSAGIARLVSCAGWTTQVGSA